MEDGFFPERAHAPEGPGDAIPGRMSPRWQVTCATVCPHLGRVCPVGLDLTRRLVAAMATGAGMAMGMGMAQNMGPWGAQPSAAPAAAPAAPPPPPPAGKDWHLAENGATKGPYGEGDLRGMVASGALTRATMVWSAGMDGWKAAGDTELSKLFALVPPPPPAP